jgi:hypothetical protein
MIIAVTPKLQKLFIGVLLVAVLAYVVWYVMHTPSTTSAIRIDSLSTDRLSSLNRVMVYWFGRHWTITVFVIAVLLFVLNIAIYMAIANTSITLDGPMSSLFTKTFLMFTVIAGLALIGVAANSFLIQNNQPYIPGMPDTYKPNIQLNQTNEKILLISLIVFVIFCAIISLGTYLKFIH